MLKRIAAALTILAASTMLARAENLIVVELYTSQGCSSCPPADAIHAELADRDDVIALALHVDYWDYLGWKDEFARPAHAERQRRYYAMVYTPQMVVHGETHVSAIKPMEITDAIRDHATRVAPVEVTLTRDGDTVEITARAVGRVPEDMNVQAVTYLPDAKRTIRTGENAGRTLDHRNVVDEWRSIDTWSGEGLYRATIDVSRDTPVVVIVQSPGQGPVLGAARSR